MPPPAPDVMIADSDGVEFVFGRCGVRARLDADRTKVISTAEQANLTFALNYGSAYVAGRLFTRYDPVLLPNDWTAYWWSCIAAAYMLSGHRCGSVPPSVQAAFDRMDMEVSQAAAGQFPLMIPSRSGSGVSIDNVRLDPQFRTVQLRTLPSISDGPKQMSPVSVDIMDRYFGPMERSI